MVRLSVRGLPGLGADFASALEVTRVRQMGRQLTAAQDVRAIAEALGRRGIDFMVVKGAVLSESIYPRPDLRPFWDIDVVVPGELFGEAVDALRASGCSVPDERSLARQRDENRGQISLGAAHGTPIDLHWHLINSRAVRRSFELEMSDLFDRARIVSVAGTRVKTLDPTDTVVHLALHAGLAGGNRLLWLKDIDQAVRTEPPLWDEFVHRARSAGAGNLLAVMLRRSHALLGTPLPDDVVAALTTSRTWKGLVGWCERVSPPERPITGPSLTRVVTRATRSGTATSLAALGRRLISDAHSRLEHAGAAR